MSCGRMPGTTNQKKKGQPDLCYSTGDSLYFVPFNHCYILFVYTVYSRSLRPFTFHPNQNNDFLSLRARSISGKL